jgi:hypothetical protein
MLRARTGARYFLIAAICAAAATACGSTAAPSGAAAPATPVPSKVSLDISVSGGPGKPVERWTLRCDPVGGTHPDPAQACAVLLKAKTPFAPVRKGVACPMILASSKTAKVTGIYFGRHVDTTFIQGGCQLARWAKIGQIFN